MNNVRVIRPPFSSPACRRANPGICSGIPPGRRRYGPGGQDSGLILPGGNNSGSNFGSRNGEGDARRLIIPGRESGGAGPSTPGIQVPDDADGALGSAGPVPRSFTNFRPPPGFMDEKTDPSSSPLQGVDMTDSEAMLGKLKTQAGYWHELAKLLPPLLRLGFDAQAVELCTGLERPLQSVWAISEQVYESLKKAENMPKDKLRMLDAPGSEHLIYEMRFLPVEARPPAAIYILDNNLSPAEATTLSRAIKDHERRNAWKEGFTDHPGDCLAYKYYRDAIEVRKEKEKLSLVEKGLAVAVSESAIEQLNKLVQEEIPKIASATRALLQIVRLTKEEVGFRPVPIVTRPLETATPEDVSSTIHISQIGLFNTFTPVSDGKTSFVGLPAYNVLLFAARPVAMLINDCSQIDAIVESVSAKTEEAKRRLEGPGMLVVDREAGSLRDLEYYLVGVDGQRVEVVAGDRLPDQAHVCGRVLFCARPPRLRDADSGDAVVDLR